MSLGTDIYVKRKVARLTQGEVAGRAGIHVNTLLDFEREKAGPDEPTYTRILSAISALKSEAEQSANKALTEAK